MAASPLLLAQAAGRDPEPADPGEAAAPSRASHAALEHLRALLARDAAVAAPIDGRIGPGVHPDRQLLEALLVAGCRLGAQALRIEAGAETARIRARVDGREQEIAQCPGRSGAAILAAVLQRSGLGPLPFDGGLHGEFSWPAADPAARGRGALLAQERFDFSIAALGRGGHALRIGIAARHAQLQPLERLGFEAHDLETITRALRQPQGLILVAGARGAGRSTTAYALLDSLDARARSIQTLEASILRPTPGWLQFKAAQPQADGGVELAQVLRNAPDVLLVDAAWPAAQWAGSVRLLAQAVADGCLVLASLAAERAHHALCTLQAAGLGPRECAAHLSLVLVQRLVRRLCAACARPDDSAETRSAVARAANSWLGGQEFRCARPGGVDCAHCGGAGYRGRTLLYELLPVEAGARGLFEEGIGDAELEQRLLSEGRGIWDHGLRLLARGLTSLQALREALREPG
jgi:hypothetical protein